MLIPPTRATTRQPVEKERNKGGYSYDTNKLTVRIRVHAVPSVKFPAVADISLGLVAMTIRVATSGVPHHIRHPKLRRVTFSNPISRSCCAC